MKFFNRGENLTLKTIQTAGDLELSSRAKVNGWKLLRGNIKSEEDSGQANLRGLLVKPGQGDKILTKGGG